MKNMIIVKYDASNINLHKTVLELMDWYCYELDVIFFIGKSASIFSKKNMDLLEQYKNKAHIYDVKLLVCGRAVEEQNIEKDLLDECVEISGYTELSICIEQAKKVVSF